MTTDIPNDPQALAQAEREAIENCETESIHDLGTIQPFGFLMATDRQALRITHASSNLADFVGVDAHSVLGSQLDTFLPRATIHQLRNAAAHETIRSQREFVASTACADHEALFDLSIHATNDQLLLEFQPTPASPDHAGPVMASVQRVMSKAVACTSIDKLLALLVEELRSLSGYDRVKAYQFLHDGAGEIVAESRVPSVDSFLGLRFPAFDIPQSARRLYASTPIRLISSVGAPQPPILAEAGIQAEPLDLSLAILRGTVDVHIMYLRNMGVGATLSLPIVIDSEMWGLFAFHHSGERAPDAFTTMACELIGQSASMLIGQLASRSAAARVQRCRAVADAHLLTGDNPLGFASYWDGTAADLAGLIDCDGVAMVAQERVDTHGDCPRPEAVKALLDHTISENNVEPGQEFAVYEQLSTDLPTHDFGATAGALVVLDPLPTVNALVFFRGGVSQTIRWAGGGTKNLERTDTGFRLNPRSSFDEYMESVDGRCEPWTSAELETATALRVAYAMASSTQLIHVQHRDRLGLLVRELNHRVRNILALVHSLIGQTQISTTSIEDYVASLRDRIAALSGAHDLFTDNDWQPVLLSDLLSRALRPFLNESAQRLHLSGAELMVSSDIANLLVLVMHELAANAAKYGSLSNDSGHVYLQWAMDGSDLVIDWHEQDGPTVEPPTREGFGTSIIRKALVFEFDAQTDLQFKPEGVVAKLRIPLDRDALGANAIALGEQAPNTPLRVLVVEDDFLIATETAALIEARLSTTCTVAPTIERALRALNDSQFDVAFLDVNLRGEFSGPVAERLQQLSIPFIFVTGYGSKHQELRSFEHQGIFTKPINAEQLATALDQIQERLAT